MLSLSLFSALHSWPCLTGVDLPVPCFTAQQIVSAVKKILAGQSCSCSSQPKTDTKRSEWWEVGERGVEGLAYGDSVLSLQLFRKSKTILKLEVYWNKKSIRKVGGRKGGEQDSWQNQHLLRVNHKSTTFTNGSSLPNICHFSPVRCLIIIFIL